MEKYVPEKCECCGQTRTYILPLSKGVANIVRAFSIAIRIKGINIIHPGKEMVVAAKDWSLDKMLQTGCITPQMWKNLTFAKSHGLIAMVRDEPGNYCLTTKGAQFLKGRRIPKYAICSKVTKHQEGYWHEELYTVAIRDFIDDDSNWEIIDYSIVEGRIIKDLPVKEPGQQSLFFTLRQKAGAV